MWLLLLVCTLFSVSKAGIVVRPRHCGGAVRHVHLAVGPDPATSMTVSFASIPSHYEKAPVAGVAIGKSPTDFHVIVVADEPPSSYNVTVAAARGANGPPDDDGNPKYWSPYYHHVTITGLEPDTTYYYQPLIAGSRKDLKHSRPNLRHSTGSYTPSEAQNAVEMVVEDHAEYEDDDELSQDSQRRRLAPPPYDGFENECPAPDKIRYFKTASNDPSQTTRLAIVGDLGQFPHSQETLQRLYRSPEEFDAVLLAGDIAYAQTDGRKWDTFFDLWDDTALAERVPIQICPGNHDIDKVADGKEIFLAYEHRFRMPRIQPPELGVYEGPKGPLNMDQPPYPLPYEYGNAYYSFTYGLAQIFMLSSYSSMEPSSKQYAWLKNGLAAVDRQVTPWLIVVLHTPLYSTFSLHRKDPQIFAAIEHLEPLFVEHDVNMIFSGHIHAYLRTKPVRFGKLHAKGPRHVVVGAGGRKCEAPFLNATAEEFVEVRDATKYGYGLFHIFNRTTAAWDWIHTGYADERDYNQVWQSEEQLPPGPGTDRVFLENQYYL